MNPNSTFRSRVISFVLPTRGSRPPALSSGFPGCWVQLVGTALCRDTGTAGTPQQNSTTAALGVTLQEHLKGTGSEQQLSVQH